MASVNWASIKVTLAKDSTGQLKKAADIRAKQVFNDAVLSMQEDFEESKITQEIDGGIAADNASETLGGQGAPRNLFSFIGFKEGDNPTQVIREMLSPTDPAGPKLAKGEKVAATGGNQICQFHYGIRAPAKTRIYKATPMPWAPGLSWAEKLEGEFPGFAHFLDRYMTSKNKDGEWVSRSGGGVQIEGELPGRTYTKPDDGYLSGIFARFLDTVRNYDRSGGLRQTRRSPKGGQPLEPL